MNSIAKIKKIYFLIILFLIAGLALGFKFLTNTENKTSLTSKASGLSQINATDVRISFEGNLSFFTSSTGQLEFEPGIQGNSVLLGANSTLTSNSPVYLNSGLTISFWLKGKDRDFWFGSRSCNLLKIVDAISRNELKLKTVQNESRIPSLEITYIGGQNNYQVLTPPLTQTSFDSRSGESEEGGANLTATNTYWENVNWIPFSISFSREGDKKYLSLFVNGNRVKTIYIDSFFDNRSVKNIEFGGNCSFYLDEVEIIGESKNEDVISQVIHNNQINVNYHSSSPNEVIVGQVFNYEIEISFGQDLIPLSVGRYRSGIRLVFPHQKAIKNLSGSNGTQWCLPPGSLVEPILSATTINGHRFETRMLKYTSAASTVIDFFPQVRIPANTVIKLKLNNLQACHFSTEQHIWVLVDPGLGYHFMTRRNLIPPLKIKNTIFDSLFIYAPTTVLPNQEFSLNIVAEDKYRNVFTDYNKTIYFSLIDQNGNSINNIVSPVVFNPSIDQGAKKVNGFRISEPGFYRIRVSDDQRSYLSFPIKVLSSDDNYMIYWGDIHTHSTFSDSSRTPEWLYRYVRKYTGLNFFSIIDHLNTEGFYFDPRFSDHRLSQDEIRELISLAKANNRPEENFVTLFGLEYIDSFFGHWNFYTKNYTNPLPLVKYVDLQRDLRNFDPQNVMIFTHHISGQEENFNSELYRRIHSISDASAVRLVDVCRAPSPMFMNFGWAALSQGFRLGFTGSSDDHTGHPGRNSYKKSSCFAGIILPKNLRLQPENVFNAFMSRNTFTATNYGMFIDFNLVRNNQKFPMGSIVQVTESSLRFRGSVASAGSLSKVEIHKFKLISRANGQIVAQDQNKFNTPEKISVRCQNYFLSNRVCVFDLIIDNFYFFKDDRGNLISDTFKKGAGFYLYFEDQIPGNPEFGLPVRIGVSSPIWVELAQ